MGHLVTLFQKNKIIVQDGFNRADNALSMGNANTGQIWQPASAPVLTFGIQSGKAYIASGAGFDITTLESGVSDRFYIEVAQTWFPNSSGIVVFRGDGTRANRMYFGINELGSLVLGKTIGGTDTSMGSTPVSPVSGTKYPLKLICSNNQIRGYLNGVLKFSVTDAALNNQTKVGIGAYAVGTSQTLFDDFIMGGL